MTFIKKNENFVCENCGASISMLDDGGCRNHCPKCLFSKHVDNYPGDRKSLCHGLMKPVDIEYKHKRYRILHRCNQCGFKRWNKCSKDDEIISWYEKEKKN